MAVKTVIKPQKLAPKQTFVRINIDPKLGKILAIYEQGYPLMSKAEILKMLLSKGIRSDNITSLNQIMKGASFLGEENEDLQFNILAKNGLI